MRQKWRGVIGVRKVRSFRLLGYCDWSNTITASEVARERGEACAGLKVLQTRIHEAKRIAVVGDGAVGMQLSADIKSFNPDKKVMLIHSREQLLPNFRKRSHEYVVGKLGHWACRFCFKSGRGALSRQLKECEIKVQG
jgi:pyruvate/2-oxoglutarate dehydrogenase complex dihydrolipoamide dehydrogenase (E3) component